MASEFLHDFYAYDIGGEGLDSASLYNGEIPERTRSRLVRNLASRKWNLVALWSEGIRDRNVLKLRFFYLCFSYLKRQLSPPSLPDRKSSNRLHQSPNLPFQYLNRHCLYLAEKCVEMYVIDLSIRTTTTKLGAQESFINILIGDIAAHLLGAKKRLMT